MNDFIVSHNEILRFVQDGVSQAVRHQLNNTSYGAGQRIQTAVDKALEASTTELQAAIARAITLALNSPAFQQQVEKTLLASLGNKFAGAFESVIRAAAKRAADDKLTSDALVTKLADATLKRAAEAAK